MYIRLSSNVELHSQVQPDEINIIMTQNKLALAHLRGSTHVKFDV